MFYVIDFGEGWRYDHGVVFSSFFSWVSACLLDRWMKRQERKWGVTTVYCSMTMHWTGVCTGRKL